MEKYKIAIIGGGLIAETAHIPGILKNQNVEIVVIVEQNSDRGNLLIEKFKLNIPVVSSISEYSGKIDAAVICTPNSFHYSNTMNCLALGIHVLVEKPISNTAKEGQEMMELADSKALVLMVGYCTRFWESIQKMRTIIKSNVLGDVKRFVFQYGAAGGWAPVSNYIMNKEKAGGGALVINGSHYLDRIIWFFNLPDSIEYYDDAKGGLEGNSELHFNYREKSIKGILKVSKTVYLEPGCVIECEKGTLIHKDWTAPYLKVDLNSAENDVQIPLELSNNKDIIEREDMYELQFNEFISKIKAPGFKALSNAEEALSTTLLMEKAYLNKKELNCNWYN